MASKTQAGRGSTSKTGSRAAQPPEDAEDPLVLPMRKTSPLTYVIAAGALAIAAGLAIFFLGGSKEQATPEAAAAPEATGKAPLTKEEQKAQLEYLKNTQAALEAAAAEDGNSPKAAAPSKNEPEPAEATAETEPKAATPAKPTASSAPSKAAPKAAPKPAVSSGQAKKKAADLDALGADITSQLK